MRRFVLLLLSMWPVAALAQPDWEEVDLGTDADLLALYRGSFPPWVVGTGGFVASVAGDYETWTVHDIGTTEDLLSIIGPSSSTRNIAGRNGAYRYTGNSGATWQSHDAPDAAQDYRVVRPNSTYFALGSAGALYADLIGNPVSWLERASGTTATLRAAESAASGLMVFGDGGTVLRADNLQGDNWTTVDLGTTADLHAVAVRGSSEMLVVGEGGLILKSTDGGLTWTPRESGTTTTLHALDDIGSALRYLVVGENGTLLQTTDFGETWCARTLPTTADLYGVAVPRSDQWFVVGEGGVMLRSQTQGGGNCTPVVATEDGPEAGYRLSSAWPNPTASRAALALSVDRPQHVTVALYDRLGRRLAVVLDGPMGADASRDLVVERGGLAAGSYVVRVQGETFAASRPITFVR